MEKPRKPSTSYGQCSGGNTRGHTACVDLAQYACSGLGFSLEPDYVQQILPLTVVARPIDLDRLPEIELLVAYRKDDKLPALAVFLALLRECMVGHSEPV